MANPRRGRRKRRTREHVIADLGVHHVEGIIIECGHTCERIRGDYGYDLVMTTFDEHGYVEAGLVLFQVKAMEKLGAIGPDYAFDLDRRDYNLWIAERQLVILVLFDASARRAVWVAVQSYFKADPARAPKPGSKCVRIRVPQRQVLNQQAILSIRQLKSRPRLRLPGGEP